MGSKARKIRRLSHNVAAVRDLDSDPAPATGHVIESATTAFVVRSGLGPFIPRGRSAENFQWPLHTKSAFFIRNGHSARDQGGRQRPLGFLSLVSVAPRIPVAFIPRAIQEVSMLVTLATPRLFFLPLVMEVRPTFRLA